MSAHIDLSISCTTTINRPKLGKFPMLDNEASGSSHFEGRSYGKCCPHVVDVEWFALFLGALGVGTIFLRNQITMNINGRKRRRRRRSYYTFPFERGIILSKLRYLDLGLVKSFF